jgi:nicotinate-nucleotide pyrophosphorylase (carboxylating)
MANGLPEEVVRAIVSRALAEDVGPGDVTSEATVAAEAQCRAEIVAREPGVIAGVQVAGAVFAALDRRIAFEALVAEGAQVEAGAALARLRGPARAVLAGERTALNFLQRMSGIATLTRRYVEAVAGTGARILDTRKTAPGLRALDKYAVRAGGGHNHRFGLFDGVLIKDNHIRAAGGIERAVRRAREAAHHLPKVEVETQTRAQVEEALAAGADVIMLDNMSAEEVAQAVKLIAGRCEVEVSGRVTLATVRTLAECGVDYLSIGALTHSAPALDLALEFADD